MIKFGWYMKGWNDLKEIIIELKEYDLIMEKIKEKEAEW